jgi:hypothetical protein
MRVPETSDVASVPQWEDSYFRSFVPKAEN